jgi:hypothetical protein
MGDTDLFRAPQRSIFSNVMDWLPGIKGIDLFLFQGLSI